MQQWNTRQGIDTPSWLLARVQGKQGGGERVLTLGNSNILVERTVVSLVADIQVGSVQCY